MSKRWEIQPLFPKASTKRILSFAEVYFLHVDSLIRQIHELHFIYTDVIY